MTTDEDMDLCPLMEPAVVPGGDGMGGDVAGVGGLDLRVDLQEAVPTRQGLIQQARQQLLFARDDRESEHPRSDYHKHMAFARHYRIEAQKTER